MSPPLSPHHYHGAAEAGIQHRTLFPPLLQRACVRLEVANQMVSLGRFHLRFMASRPPSVAQQEPPTCDR